MKLKVVCVLFIVLLTLVPSILLNQEILVKADEGAENPSTEVIDYHNGTIRTIVDYGNGTQDHTVETTVRKTATLHYHNGSNLSLFLAKSNESEGQIEKVTETKTMQEEVVMGFTKEFLKERYQIIDVPMVVAYFRLEVDFDFEFGLRLPVNISVEYPATVDFDGSIETLNVTIIPIDDPDLDEFLCIYQISLKVEAGILEGLWWKHYSYGPVPVWGEDRSKSFKTPMGDNIVFPIGRLELVTILEVWGLVSISLEIAPGFGSKKVTATASAFGDSNITGFNNIEWSEPNQTFPLDVQFGGIDASSEGAKIAISDFRYYFTEFALDFYLTAKVDLIVVHWEFPVLLFEIPMSWIYNYLGYYYISSEQTVDLWFGPPDVRRDIAVTSVFCDVDEIRQGGLVNITVVVENLGASTETFNVTAYYDEEPIATISNEVLENGTSRTFHFTWDTSAVAAGSYVISGEATQVPDEFDINNNIKVDKTVTVRVLYELRVKIIDNMGNPISNVKVEVNGETKLTDGGMAVFTLEKGNYTVTASKENYNPMSMNISLNQDTTLTFILTLPYGPEASFTAVPDTASISKSIKFDASASLPGWNGTHGMPITEYRWDFWDGNTTTTSTPIVYHSFSSSGIYYVALTVYAPGATPETDSTTKKVTITAIPVGGYSFPIKEYTTTTTTTTTRPLTLYLALIAILTASFTITKRRKKQQD